MTATGRFALIVAALLVLAGAAQAAEYTWTATGGGSWGTGGDWNSGSVPPSGSDIEISGYALGYTAGVTITLDTSPHRSATFTSTGGPTTTRSTARTR